MTKIRRSSRLKPIDGNSHRRLVLTALSLAGAVLILLAVGYGLCCGYAAIKKLCDEQCRVVDQGVDVVVVTPGVMVMADVVKFHFGLTNGANLAEIDFGGLRECLLRRVPNIRDLTIERRLPNRVTIEVKEREPIARVMGAGKKSPTGLMVDAEGVIFRFVRSAATYPVVRTTGNATLEPGGRLGGRSAAALRLLETAALPDFISLNVQEADAAPKDYVLVTLGDYSRAKVAWEEMDEDTPRARESLARQLRRLSKAIASNLAAKGSTWIVTDYGTPGRIYAAENDR